MNTPKILDANDMWTRLPLTRRVFPVPKKWRHGLPDCFQLLEWVYPSNGRQRIGVYQYLLDPETIRQKRVFIWKRGNDFVTAVRRLAPLDNQNREADNIWNNKQAREPSARIVQQIRQPSDSMFKKVSFNRYFRCGVMAYQHDELETRERKKLTLVAEETQGLQTFQSTSVAEQIPALGLYTSNNEVESKRQFGTPRQTLLVAKNTKIRCGPEPSSVETRKSDYTDLGQGDTVTTLCADTLHLNSGTWWSSEATLVSLSSIKLSVIPPQFLTFPRDEEGPYIIGEGAFGKVCLASLVTSPPLPVVVKIFTKGNFTMEGIYREAQMLSYLNTTGLIPKFCGLLKVDHSPELAIVQEFFGLGTHIYQALVQYARTLRKGTWLDVAHQLAIGLQAIHDMGVLINDIKADNILVDCNISSGKFSVRYIDFGLATFKEGRISYARPEDREMYSHIAPEVLCGQPTRPSSDVYGLGRVFRLIMISEEIGDLAAVTSYCLAAELERPSALCLVPILANIKTVTRTAKVRKLLEGIIMPSSPATFMYPRRWE